MDGLASDLGHALEESQLPQYLKNIRGHKKRSKISTSGGIGMAIAMNGHAMSEDSSNSFEDAAPSQEKSSMALSDSDEMSPQEQRMRSLHFTHHRAASNVAESDSLNETMSPGRFENREKRKQKYKRLAFETSIPSTSSGCLRSYDGNASSSLTRRRRGLRMAQDSDPKIVDLIHGKRKRGNSESSRGLRRESSSGQSKFNAPKSRASTPCGFEIMDFSGESNVESSGESDPGLFTCDEGREADDEQSDFFAEPGPSYGIPDRSRIGAHALPQVGQFSPSSKAFFKERYEKMSRDSQQSCRLRFRKLRGRLMRREIRVGRRRLQERRPGFSIVSTLNEKVSRFVRDASQIELKLRPLTERDMVQLRHLADLYSLELNPGTDLSCPTLIKTCNTMTMRPFEPLPSSLPCSVSLEQKRPRRTTPPCGSNMTEGSNDSIESVVASRPGPSSRPPVPITPWSGDDVADSLSERLADSEPEPLPSPSSLGLNECKL